MKRHPQLRASITMIAIFTASLLGSSAISYALAKGKPPPASAAGKACESAPSCFKLNITCVGEYRCLDQRWWGCGRGVCIPPTR